MGGLKGVPLPAKLIDEWVNHLTPIPSQLLVLGPALVAGVVPTVSPRHHSKMYGIYRWPFVQRKLNLLFTLDIIIQWKWIYFFESKRHATKLLKWLVFTKLTNNTKINQGFPLLFDISFSNLRYFSFLCFLWFLLH